MCHYACWPSQDPEEAAAGDQQGCLHAREVQGFDPGEYQQNVSSPHGPKAAAGRNHGCCVCGYCADPEDHPLEHAGGWPGDGARDTYGVKFKEVPWWDGAKAGFYFGTWTHDDGRVLVGYVSDRGVIPCSAFLGKKTNRIYTTRDGILGYHHDVGPSAIKTDSLIDQEVRQLGWGVSICPEPCSSFGPQQPEPEPTCPEDKLQRAPPADDEASPEAYTLRAATMMLNRLKKNKGRLSTLGDTLKSMVLSDDPEVTKELKELIMKNNGDLKKVDLQTQDIVESNDAELGLSRVAPMTRAQATCLSCAAVELMIAHVQL